MYKLKWIDHKNEMKKVIGEFETKTEAINSIQEWWREHSFTPSYTRCWEKDNTMYIDYGLHDVFYVISPIKNTDELSI